MKILVAIPTCHKNALLVRACKETWVNEWSHLVDIRFFFGRPTFFPCTPLEISLDVDDGYKQLPLKVLAMYRWILDNGYDRVFKCDDDTYVHIPRLLSCGKDEFDFVGRPDLASRYTHWMQGGAGYWLSRKAMEYLVNLPLDYWKSHWAEDRLVGIAMYKSGLSVSNDRRLFDAPWVCYPSTPAPGNNSITAHKCDVARHHAIHQAFASIKP